MAEELTAYQKLTPKQRLFVDFYVGDEAFGNATKAARRAGYAKPEQQGWQVRNTPAVQAAIEEQLQGRVPTKFEVLAGIGRMTRGSMADFIDVGGCDLSEEAQQILSQLLETADLVLAEVWEEGGLPLGVAERIEEKRQQVQELAEKVREATRKRPWTFNFEKAAREGVLHLIQEIGTTDNGATKLKLHDPLAAYEKLARFYKLFVERHEVTGPDGGPVSLSVDTLNSALERAYGDPEPDSAAGA